MTTEGKKRNECLTTWLVFMIVANSGIALIQIYLIGSGKINRAMTNINVYTYPMLFILPLFNLVCTIALFRWKKWGFWGFCGSSVVALVAILSNGLGIGLALGSLIGVPLLYGALNIGKENKGWPQLEWETTITSETTGKAKRPTSITVICVIGFIGTLITVPLIFLSIAEQVGSWYPPYLGFSAVIGLVCMVGLWMMRKWAAYTYTGFVALNQVVLLAMGVWNIIALLIPAIVIFFALKNVSKMT